MRQDRLLLLCLPAFAHARAVKLATVQATDAPDDKNMPMTRRTETAAWLAGWKLRAYGRPLKQSLQSSLDGTLILKPTPANSAANSPVSRGFPVGITRHDHKSLDHISDITIFSPLDGMLVILLVGIVIVFAGLRYIRVLLTAHGTPLVDANRAANADAQAPARERHGVLPYSPPEHLAAVQAPPVPEAIVLRRKDFGHIQNVAFASWEELVRAIPGGSAPQGKSTSIVTCDPMQIFAWVATLLIQCCFWGLVAFYTERNGYDIGIALAVLYGVILYLCVKVWLPPQMASMIWPNLPVSIGTAGFLICLRIYGDEHVGHGDFEHMAARTQFFSILPATLSAAIWMRKLPNDPDRAVLVSNLLFGIWASVPTTAAMFGIGLNSMYDITWWSLLLIGAAAIAAAIALQHSKGRWASVELVTWTLNIGATGVSVATSALLMRFSIAHPAYELMGWVPFAAVASVLGFLGMSLGRTLPVLLSAIDLLALSTRASVWVSMQAGSAVAGFCCFGVLGVVIIAVTQRAWNTYSSVDDRAVT
eukprot:gnl/TRDRNA2_/TRDRNA2_41706_c0_seq1.p1 gnl/TRDRNA2_/TRDRNA2_41706_c0~~gnl/TRDRNA2_/TRDRNA2_41706_c0_seq1.p1  ORF type:complete len:546 (+),score=45.55 gnl/TRDRNA2_/TRDRNA2_41706_c0_seq1:38-1639(+)